MALYRGWKPRRDRRGARIRARRRLSMPKARRPKHSLKGMETGQRQIRCMDASAAEACATDRSPPLSQHAGDHARLKPPIIKCRTGRLFGASMIALLTLAQQNGKIHELAR